MVDPQIEIAVRAIDFKQNRQFITHERIKAGPMANAAMTLIHTMLAQTAAHVDQINADNVVALACSITTKAFDEFENRGWLIEMPPLSDLLVEEQKKVGF